MSIRFECFDVCTFQKTENVTLHRMGPKRKTHKAAGKEQKASSDDSLDPDPKSTSYKDEPRKLNKAQNQKSKVSNQKAKVQTKSDTGN